SCWSINQSSYSCLSCSVRPSRNSRFCSAVILSKFFHFSSLDWPDMHFSLWHDDFGTKSWPCYHRRQRGENRIHVSAGAQAENRAAVIEQIEFHIAAAAHELFFALGLAPGRRKIAPHQRGIDVQECASDILREGERRI